jgi:hypothetical protein
MFDSQSWHGGLFLSSVDKVLRLGNFFPKQLSINKFINQEYMTPRAGLACNVTQEEK